MKTATVPHTAPVDGSHPENAGSIDAARYFMQMILTMDDGLEEFVRQDHKAALKLYESAVKDLLKVPYRTGLIKANLNLGNVYYLMGSFQEAVESYRKALSLTEAAGDLRNRASVLGNIGCAVWASGEYDSAQGYLDQAYEVFESVDDPAGRSNTLINIGVLQETRGNPGKAAAKFFAAVQADPTNFKGAVYAKRHIGQIYRMEGRFALSEAAYLEAFEIGRRIKDFKLQAAILTDLGILYTEWAKVQRQPDKYWAALERLSLALEISERTGLPDLYLKKYIGDLHLEMGDDSRAESYLVAAGFNSSLGRLALARNDFEKAKTHFQQLSRSAEAAKRTEDLMAATTGLGQVYEAAGDFPKAEKYYSAGMAAAEEIRESRLLSERWNFFSVPISGFLPSEPAKGVTRVGIKNGEKTGRISQSIYAGEVTKARKFTDHIALKADLSKQAVSKELKDQEDALLAQRASLLKARSLITRTRDGKLYDDKTKEIEKVEKKIRKLVDTLWQRYPEYAAARHPRPVELNRAALDPGEYVIIFDVLGEGVSARLLKGSKIVRTAFSKLTRRELEELIDRLRAPLDDHQLVDASDLQGYDVELAKTLYKELLSNVLEEVPRGTLVTIVPDEALAKIPFEALVAADGDSRQGDRGNPQGVTYVADLYPINYVSSVTGLTLSRTMRRSALVQDRLLVMADPTFDASDPRLNGAGRTTADTARAEAAGGTASAENSADAVQTAADVSVRAEANAPRAVSAERTMAPVAGRVRSKALQRDTGNSAPAGPPGPSREARGDGALPSASSDDGSEYVLTWPRLDLTGNMGRAIKQLYPDRTDLHLGRDADKSVLLNAPLRRYGAIVFGTHGYFGRDIPGIMEPVLVLNMVPDQENGYLRMSEVMGLDLNADFVALTACRTGLGQYLMGEGILSMGRAFQYAGARSVLMSLWTVPEEASVLLMESFMKNLKAGASKADALAAARTEVRKLKEHYSHPFYWAAFVLAGDAGPASGRFAADRVSKGLR
ncbi:MAG: CHAT domain-containing tetratricopeptide repeat protein [Pseudomonadota bacterium]